MVAKITTPFYIDKIQSVKTGDDRELAVPKTNNDVYKITLLGEVSNLTLMQWNKKAGRNYPIALALNRAGKTFYFFSKSIRPLTPAVGM